LKYVVAAVTSQNRYNVTLFQSQLPAANHSGSPLSMLS